MPSCLAMPPSALQCKSSMPIPVAHMQNVSDLQTGIAAGYTSGQIFYDVFNVSLLAPFSKSRSSKHVLSSMHAC